MVPEKVGLKAVQRDNVDYEFTLVFDLDIKHNAVASKDRTGLFMNRPEFVITPQVGKLIRNWCNTTSAGKQGNQSSQTPAMQPNYQPQIQNYGNTTATPTAS